MIDRERRNLLVHALGAIVGGCSGQAAAPDRSCASRAEGLGLPYCLVASVRLKFPGARSLTVGEAEILALDDNTAAILARDALGFYALSAICPHSCCTVHLCHSSGCASVVANPHDCQAPVRIALAGPGAAFLCACHGSQFGADGAVLKGPALSGLPAVPLEFVGDDALVDVSRTIDVANRVNPEAPA